MMINITQMYLCDSSKETHENTIALSMPKLHAGISLASIKRYFLLKIIITFPDRKKFTVVSVRQILC